MGDGRRDSRDGLGQAWDRWTDRVNVPDEDDDPLRPRDVLITVAAFVAVAGGLLLLHTIVDFNWGWVPWKKLAVAGLLVAAVARWAVRAGQRLLRRMRGLPPLEREPTERDRLAEKLRELDEPYQRHERTTTVPD